MSTKTLDLRGLSEAERDAKLSIALAEIYLGGCLWHDQINGKFVRTKPLKESIDEMVKVLPPYATSADAVVALLEKYGDVDITMTRHAGKNGVVVCIDREESTRSTAPTFPLAACLALLRANGYEVLT